MNKKSFNEIFIGALALMNAIILILDIVLNLSTNILTVFYYIDLIIWGIFVLDFFWHGYVSKNKLLYLYKHKIDILSLITVRMYAGIINYLGILNTGNIINVISFLQVIRLIILLLKFKDKIRTELKISKLNYMLILTSVVIVVGALVISLLEHMSFGDALWWSFVTFTTVGYGDVMLKTTLGRIVAVILMIFGIGFIGITTSTIAAYIINGNRNNKNSKIDLKKETLNHIKYRIDNIDELSDEDLDDIYKILRSLRNEKP